MDPRTAEKKLESLRLKALARQGSSHALRAGTNKSGLGSMLRTARGMVTPHDSAAAQGGGAAPEGDVEGGLEGQPAGDAAALAAADFVAALHTSPDLPGTWFVLGGCSGEARAGEVVGLLGPSGCGKTSLLGAIAGSASDLGAAAVTGSITIDGQRSGEGGVLSLPTAALLVLSESSARANTLPS